MNKKSKSRFNFESLKNKKQDHKINNIFSYDILDNRGLLSYNCCKLCQNYFFQVLSISSVEWHKVKPGFDSQFQKKKKKRCSKTIHIWMAAQ